MHNNDDLDSEGAKAIADDIKHQAEQKGNLETPEVFLEEAESTADASKEDFFLERPVDTLEKFRLDAIEAVYMLSSDTRYVLQGLDTEKKEIQIRIYDFLDNKWKELYTDICKGNFICVKDRLNYLKLSDDSIIELVGYDLQELKEVHRHKYTNDFEVKEVSIVEDQAEILGIKDQSDIEQNLIIANTKENQWEFRRISDYSKILWKVEAS